MLKTCAGCSNSASLALILREDWKHEPNRDGGSIYSEAMDLLSICDEIDAELDRLARIRKIVAELATPTRRRRRRPIAQVLAVRPISVPTPVSTVLPSKLKREYRRKAKPIVPQPTALAAPISDKPVFVPRAPFVAARSEEVKATELDLVTLEAAFRQNLMIPSALSNLG